MAKKIELQVLVNIVLLIVFVLLIVIISVKYSSQIYRVISEPDLFRDLLLAYGNASILVFILFQVLQVIIATIPGELVQIAGGYIYGTWFGTLYSLIGILIGYFIVFWLTRLLGYPLVKVFVPEEKYKKISNLIKTKKSDAILFLLFFIPGLPKDFLVYIGGLTPVEPLKFFLIITFARFPALFGSSFIGAHLEQENYLIVAIVTGLSALLFIVGFIFRDKILAKIESVYGKQRDTIRNKVAKNIPEKDIAEKVNFEDSPEKVDIEEVSSEKVDAEEESPEKVNENDKVKVEESI